jgi:starch phosphorylase
MLSEEPFRISPRGDGDHLYAGAIPCRTSGLHGYAVRILPHNPDIVTPFVPGLIRWG